MPNPSRPAHLRFDLSFQKAKSSEPLDEGASLRMAILGHFGGRSRSESAPLTAVRVDVDNFDTAGARFGARWQMPPDTAGALEADLSFERLEDFHPDHLLKTVPSLAQLTQLRTRLLDAGTAADAAAQLRNILGVQPAVSVAESAESQPEDSTSDTFARLLGNPAPATPAAPHPASASATQSLLDRLLQNAVTASKSPAPSPDQAPLLDQLDAELSARLRQILHHPGFQAIESAWRALDFLVREAPDNVEIHVIDVSREELESQLASEDNPAATAVGRQIEQIAPFVVLSPWSFGVGDAGVLQPLARCAAACGTAMVAGGASDLVGCASFASQPDPHDWATPDGPEAAAFMELRRAPESAHLGLTAPRFLLRLPYGAESDPIDTFSFEELPSGDLQEHENYLWGSSAFLCGRRLINAFAENGWEMELDGTGSEIGGLPVHRFVGSDGEKQVKPCAEAWLTDRAADRLLQNGLMPVQSVRGSDSAILVSLRSISDPAGRLAFRLG